MVLSRSSVTVGLCDIICSRVVQLVLSDGSLSDGCLSWIRNNNNIIHFKHFVFTHYCTGDRNTNEDD